MPKQLKNDYFDLKFTNLKINLIFSAAVNISDFMFTKRSILTRKKLFKLGTSPNRCGVSPSLQLKDIELYRKVTHGSDISLIFPDANLTKHYENRIKIHCLIRIFRGGSASITLTIVFRKIEKGEYFTLLDIFRIMDLIKQTNASKKNQAKKQVKIKEGGKKPVNLAKWLLTRLKNLQEEVEHHIKEETNIKKEKRIVSKQDDQLQNKPVEELEFFDLRKDLPGDENHYQNPYLVVIADLTDEYKSMDEDWWFTEKMDKPKQKLNELNLLLRRYALGREIMEKHAEDLVLPLRYNITEDSNPLLNSIRNFSWFQNMFISAHARSTILLYAKVANRVNNAIAVQARYFLEDSILDLQEMLRARWHFRVILNHLLDLFISKIHSFPDDPKAFEGYFKLRHLYARFLSSPISHKLEGGVVYEIYKECEKNFQLEELADLNKEKFKVIDSILSDFATLDQMTAALQMKTSFEIERENALKDLNKSNG